MLQDVDNEENFVFVFFIIIILFWAWESFYPHRAVRKQFLVHHFLLFFIPPVFFWNWQVMQVSQSTLAENKSFVLSLAASILHELGSRTDRECTSYPSWPFCLCWGSKVRLFIEKNIYDNRCTYIHMYQNLQYLNVCNPMFMMLIMYHAIISSHLPFIIYHVRYVLCVEPCAFCNFFLFFISWYIQTQLFSLNFIFWEKSDYLLT